MSDPNTDVVTGDPTQPFSLTVLAPDPASDADAEDISDISQSFLNAILRVAKFSVTDPADLSGLTGIIDKEKCYVHGFGTYQYDAAASSPAANLPWVVEGPSGVGRFFHPLWRLLTSLPANGMIAVADGAAVLVSRFPSKVRETRALNSNDTATNFTSASWANVTDRHVTFSTALSGGDAATHRIEAHCSFAIDVPSGVIVDVRLVVDINGAISPVNGTSKRIQLNGQQVVSLCFYESPPGVGTPITVRLQAKLVSGASVAFNETNIIAKLIGDQVGS